MVMMTRNTHTLTHTHTHIHTHTHTHTHTHIHTHTHTNLQQGWRGHWEQGSWVLGATPFEEKKNEFQN